MCQCPEDDCASHVRAVLEESLDGVEAMHVDYAVQAHRRGWPDGRLAALVWSEFGRGVR